VKTKIYDRLSIPASASKGIAKISVNPKYGLFRISIQLAQQLRLKDEDNKIIFLQDEDRPTDWYIRVTKERNGFQVKPDGKTFFVRNRYLSRFILQSCNLEIKSCSFMVSEKESEKNTYAIITKSAK
jgi:hypothetical protein